MPDIYTANDVHVGGIYRNGDHIASCRGDDLEAPQVAQGIALALNSFGPEAIRNMRAQLGIARTAMERARDVLTLAAETHPDQGDGSDVTPTHSGGIAGDCEAAAQDAVEGLWFIDQVLLALPVVIPFKTAEDAAALAAAHDAARKRMTPVDFQAVGMAVQWAGHFAVHDGAEAGGPAFSNIAEATVIIEDRGFTIPHSRAAREKIAATNDMRASRSAAANEETKGEGN